MKQTITLPLYSIYSLIQNMEEMANNPETAKQYKDLLSALDILKETFMPLIDEFKDCNCMPNVDAMVDTESEGDDGKIDWEQRKFELIKASVQGRLAATDRKFGFQNSFASSIAKEAIMMADIVIEQLKRKDIM